MVKHHFTILAITQAALSERLYTDGTFMSTSCTIPYQTGSIEFPCEITDIYYTGMEADIRKNNPYVVAYVLNQPSGTITAICKGKKSYTVLLKSGEKCDLKKIVIDPSTTTLLKTTQPLSTKKK